MAVEVGFVVVERLPGSRYANSDVDVEAEADVDLCLVARHGYYAMCRLIRTRPGGLRGLIKIRAEIVVPASGFKWTGLARIAG